MSVSRETLPKNLGLLLGSLAARSEFKGLEFPILKSRGFCFGGFSEPALDIVLTTLWYNGSRPTVFLFDSMADAESTFHRIDNLVGQNAFLLPGQQDTAADVAGFVGGWERYQADLAKNLTPSFAGVILASHDSIKQRFFQSDNSNNITLKTNYAFPPDRLVESLSAWGYERVDHVYTPKSFAVRGGIVDIFTLTDALPTRIEFFGSSIESIRSFNPLSQRTVAQLEVLELFSLPDANTAKALTVEEVVSGPINSIFVRKDKSGYSIGNSKTINPQFINCESTSFVRLSREAKSALLANYKKRFGIDNIYLFIDSEKQIDAALARLDFRPVFIIASLSGSFTFPDENIACLSYSDLFGVSAKSVRRWSLPETPATHRAIGSINSIEWGDLLVHKDYGIGVYRGLEKVTGRTATQECIKIEYADSGVVYVPVDKFSNVHKYIPAGDSSPSLSRLGTSTWEKEKLKTKKSAARVVGELVQLYAQRNKNRGYTYSPDSELLDELKGSFPFTETPDQLQAITDVLEDLRRPTPMDRLVCGDVGFGKTEVALRAALGAISSGFKVALLAPTTILADQHYLTAKNRLEPLGVRVELLSRFKSPKEQKQIVGKLANGFIDMVIGTHRLLSPDVDIPGLGLLIVDEEHRFGVRHKERIKQLKHNVDVLTLTATPIPRTLQQSLIGVRDVSKIDTPPKERLPVRTAIIHFDWQTIINAIRRELDRSGQVFFLHNNIENLPFYTEQLQNVFPGRRVAYAHGRMSSRPLENTMLAFFDGKIDILVCTTIIESGLDIPNVNTIIINDAHRFGLAQIYQIRGRVGRSSRQAYCYLAIPKNFKLNKTAYQRLKAIEYYSNLGSGYDIALKDLEIRGAGNMFGFEQSGQIAAVGFELYCKILKESVDEALGFQSGAARPSPHISYSEDALIPADYMDLVQDRLFFYQKLAALDNVAEINLIREELRDRFGPVPIIVENLLFLTRLNIMANNSGLKSLNISAKTVTGTVGDLTRFPDSMIMLNAFDGFLKLLSLPYRFHSRKSDRLSIEVTTGNITRSKSVALGIVELFSPIING